MLNLSLALLQEKNKLTATAPWLLLLTLTPPGGSPVRFARNTEDIVFDGDTYLAFAFELGELRSGSDGKVQGVGLRVANPDRAFAPLMDANDGLIGSAVELTVVHAENLAENYADLTLSWIVMSSVVEDEWLSFELGAESPMRRRFPLYAGQPASCNWIFKGAECAYAGAETVCDRSLDRCRVLGNSSRFGGRPGAAGAPRFVAK